ncbi:MAG: diaminopimelate epimerase [Alphaproteobacteria bacterium]|nr:diaminopimelate epimerase [Alphaproteobacteria bacterium]
MIPFTKMHGLGNDFVVIDRRKGKIALSAERMRAIGDRHRGVGFDQLVFVDPPKNGQADVAFRFHNQDGSEAGACGNGTRCVAAAVMAETGGDTLAIETIAGLLRAEKRGDGLYAVDMGAARTGWRDIPLARDCDTLALPLAVGPLADPVAVGMGNPHCVFFVGDTEAVDLERYGPEIERHPLFPERTNVEVASITGKDKIRLRVWERGVGITLACGSGACATGVAAARRGLAGRTVEIDVDGGALSVDWLENGHVVLTGPVAVSFKGELAP